jgi:hypothetical protein
MIGSDDIAPGVMQHHHAPSWTTRIRKYPDSRHRGRAAQPRDAVFDDCARRHAGQFTDRSTRRAMVCPAPGSSSDR